MPEIVTGNFAPCRWVLWPPSSLRVVDWNINRGLELHRIIDFLAGADADVVTLQEVDVNARRTHRLNVAEEIARSLQMDYVFGREFQELVQGSKVSPAYHGQATLSKWPILNPRLIRFSRQSHFWEPHWFLPKIEPFQERLGGRIALVADINVAGSTLVTYNLHLESKASDALRLSQLKEVLSDAARRSPQCPTLVAGDFNLDVSRDAAAVALAIAGFHDAVTVPRTSFTTPRSLFDGGQRIDWAFIHGPIRAGSAQVHNRVTASDHYPISFTLSSFKN
ncbi:MAG TPA: endonuclease/exonuclease/phosphatase family protein [Candidatus Binatia bacterium]|nr:endonuclease/exonuclease/phosphatase family protein [Candidatus Binatia bacterium]